MIIIITTTTITTTITLKNKNSNNNKNKKNNSTNDKAVYNAKLQTRLLEIQNEKHTKFSNV